jgi:uncharacterized membrane protein
MKTPASISGHPIHPMLVVFPIGLWVSSFISDLIFLFGKNLLWNRIAFYTMAGGLIGALLAAIPGLIDMFSIRDPKVGEVAWNHMLVNIVTTIAFALNLFLRLILEPGALFPILLSLMGVALLAYAGWLGGELAYVHGVGVHTQQRSVEPESARTNWRRAG